MQWQSGRNAALCNHSPVCFCKTSDDLEERLIRIQGAVETAEYHCTVMLHEQKQEWQSLLLPYRKQQKLNNARDGQILPGSVLGDGNPLISLICPII